MWVNLSRWFLAFLTVTLTVGIAFGRQSAPIADAAMRGDFASVRDLLDAGADVNAAGAFGTPALHWVVRFNDLETASRLLSAGADASFRDAYDVTPLSLASSNGNAAMIRLLLEAGADPNSTDRTGETALMAATRVGDIESVSTLLEAGAEVDSSDPEFQQTALMFAARENHLEVARLLIDHGADVSAATRIGPTPEWFMPNASAAFGHGIGINRGGLPERGSRIPIQGGQSPLHFAARDGHLEMVDLLLDAGADVNQVEANAITPLVMALNNNQIEVARLLIERGADLDARDWYGRSPLWSAVEVRNVDLHNATQEHAADREGALEIIELLLRRGADPNARTAEVPPTRRHILPTTGSLSWVDFTGQTPFITAALAGDVTVMRLLLEFGADPHIQTAGGTTALMAAAGVNWVFFQTFDEGAEKLLEAVELCVELGMDVNATNSMGLTALMGAANRGSDDIIEFLVEQGARLDVEDAEGRTVLNWAEGVFLATNPAQPKPSSIELIQELMQN